MVTCRIFLLTYNRNQLLPRAVNSILNQTFTNWVCELHNDNPEDNFPAEYIRSLNDDRFVVINHPQNLGATSTFNLAFAACNEDYASILEDDNWWEPAFLQTGIEAMLADNSVEVIVCNENIWVEQIDGSWHDTRQTIWPETMGQQFYTYNLVNKCGSAKICNSSMIWKTQHAAQWITPNNIPVDVTEHFRERLMPHPILLINTPLANYARTLVSHRSKDTAVWGAYQVLLIASVFQLLNFADSQKFAARLWEQSANNSPYQTTLINTALAIKQASPLLKYVSTANKFRYLLTILRNPIRWFKIVNASYNYPTQWTFLLEHTYFTGI
ncbi:glycosyl transferase family 2 [Mucilaginibacter yixingensis]|uniref:Glycosyl transferase family 2 n=1 Tax=Mucilaginibacter yixingensis TaxID=1295612 RepID=A0A2T5JFR8_9SPHI|nr:glycosyltransferase family 2 protein [Mucilaginibacter yixingensis]PTR01271.1 glycosyl transferase family 2 [Mucilaginibacter yixingensis]